MRKKESSDSIVQKQYMAARQLPAKGVGSLVQQVCGLRCMVVGPARMESAEAPENVSGIPAGHKGKVTPHRQGYEAHTEVTSK